MMVWDNGYQDDEGYFMIHIPPTPTPTPLAPSTHDSSLTYETLLSMVYHQGQSKMDRTGTGTKSLFGHQIRYDLRKGFPLITTKKVHFKSIVVELLWFLQGQSNVQWLHEHGCTIWDEWADEKGDLGPIYGVQWRSWPSPHGQHIDQITQVLHDIQHHPDSRRLVVSAWNVSELHKMALAPCHVLFQFYVHDGVLSCQVYQRSADMFLGVPFNLASYALLTHMVAQQCDLQVGDLIWTGGDCHIYDNHHEQVKLQLSRTPYSLPQLKLLRCPLDLFGYHWSDFEVLDYQHHAAIRGAVAV